MDSASQILYTISALIVILYCSKTGVYFLKELNGNRFTVQGFLYLLFLLFYIAPVVSQITFTSYQYEVFWRANDAMRDLSSLLLYLLFVTVFTYFIKRSSRNKYTINTHSKVINTSILNVCSLVVVLCFAITIAISGVQVLLNGYGYAYFNREAVDLNEGFIGCGIVSYLVVLSGSKYISKSRLFFLTLIIFAFFWIEGKRSIIAETMIMIICVLASTGVINGRKTIRYLVVAGGTLLPLCFLYGIFLKQNVDSFLDYFNVDFSRQYTLVYQFYCDEIGREISINKFDSVLYLLSFFIPRIFWLDKPYPFVNNLTYSLVGNDSVEFSNAGWATTCSIFSDLFDSFKELGLVIGIFIFVKLFNKANSETRMHYKVMWIYLIERLLTVQISSAIVQIVFIFVLLTICEKIFRKKNFKYTY